MISEQEPFACNPKLRDPLGIWYKPWSNQHDYRLEEENVMETRAAIAFEAGKPLTIETVSLEGPKEGKSSFRLKPLEFVILMPTLCQDVIPKESFPQF